MLSTSGTVTELAWVSGTSGLQLLQIMCLVLEASVLFMTVGGMAGCANMILWNFGR
jgi:hypothetical protein